MFIPKLSFFVVPLPTMYRPCPQAFFCAILHTLFHIPGVTRVQVKNTHLWPVQINFSMTRDDACTLIVQAAGCAATWILENAEAQANALSCVGRIARPRQRRLVFICLLVTFTFDVHIACHMNCFDAFINCWLRGLIALVLNCASIS